ncbi:MAG: class IV adenylate cyclase [Phycisphaerae bacterium]|nr:class IV adenylate cyclase [Phycisphaerae bacterium]
MNHEIEAKIKVAALEPVISELKELGAQFLHTMQQIDTYFMDTHKLLHKNDCGLRIRRQTINGKQSACITFKGAREKTKYKSRPEYETGIDNVEMMENIFEALGYHKRLVVEKKRSVWRLDACEVCLDELPDLGCFVEVEGADEETISSVLAKLNLQDQPHISKGYASMTAQKRKQTENDCF